MQKAKGYDLMVGARPIHQITLVVFGRQQSREAAMGWGIDDSTPAHHSLVRWLAVVVALTGLLWGQLATAQPMDGFARQLLTGKADGPAPVLAGFRLVAAEPTGNELALRFAPERGGAEVLVLLGPKTPGFRAYATTPSFRVSWQSATEGVVTPPAAVELTAAVVAQITPRDDGTLQLPKAPRRIATSAATVETWVDAPLQTATNLVLLAGLAALCWLLALDVWQWRDALRGQGPPAQQPWCWAAVLLLAGVAVRALSPQTLVMVHMGHELFEPALALGPPPKYGPAAPAWLAGWFALVGPGWPKAVALSQLCSSLSLLLLPGLWRRLGGTTWGAVGALGGVALTPVLVHDAATESILVPAMLGVVGSASAASRWPEWPRLAPFAAAALASVAMLARPELLLLAPLVVVVAVAARPGALRAYWPALALVVGWFAAIGAARAIQLQAVMELERVRGNTPRVFAASKLVLLLELLRDAWWRKNGLLWPELVPTVWWLGLGWLVWRRPAGARASWVALGLAWLFLAPTSLDLPWISVPRVQAPAMMWFAASGGAALALLLERLSQRQRIAAAVGAVGLVLTTLPAAYSAHPSETEERAFAAAVRALPHTVTLVTRTHNDPPDERVHLGVADSLLGPRQRLAALNAVLSGSLVPGRDGRVFAWLGTRCAMRPCDTGGRHPACTALELGWQLREVQTTNLRVTSVQLPKVFAPRKPAYPGQVPDLDFPWCWQQPDVSLRLVEVLGPKRP